MVVTIIDEGKPRGFGFVTFKDQRAYYSALDEQHMMNGKKLDLKAANPREQNLPPPPAKDKKTQENRKIFIGGLPKDLSMNEFRSYFERYGEIVDIAIISDKKTREPRGRLRLKKGSDSFHSRMYRVLEMLFGIMRYTSSETGG